MPERLDNFTIRLSRGDIVLTWDERTAIVHQMKHFESFAPIRDAFAAVGASRPVELTREQHGQLLEVIEFWANHTAGGYDALPAGILELRNALHDDLHGTG